MIPKGQYNWKRVPDNYCWEKGRITLNLNLAMGNLAHLQKDPAIADTDERIIHAVEIVSNLEAELSNHVNNCFLCSGVEK